MYWYLILAIFVYKPYLKTINSFMVGPGRKCNDKQGGIYKDRKCILMTEFKIFKWEGIYEAPQQIAHVMWHDNFHY